MTLSAPVRRTRAGKNRRMSLTEIAILNEGFGMAWRKRSLSVPELADRMEVSVHSLLPHIRSLIAKGEIEPVSATDIRYQRTGGAV